MNTRGKNLSCGLLRIWRGGVLCGGEGCGREGGGGKAREVVRGGRTRAKRRGRSSIIGRLLVVNFWLYCLQILMREVLRMSSAELV